MMLANIYSYIKELKLTTPYIKRCLRSYHFWIITVLVIAISLFYYLWYPAIASYRAAFWFIIFEVKNSIQGSLYAVPFAYAAVFFKVRGAVITYLVALCIVLPHITYLALNGTSIFINILYSMIPLLVIVLISVERNWRERTKKAMIPIEN
jgi:hypothetical protein